MSTKTRKSNGQGHTYKVGNSWKTVITSKGRAGTATNKGQQEPKRRAKYSGCIAPANFFGGLVLMM